LAPGGSVLLLDGLTAGYHQTTVLRDVSMRISDGEFVAVLGPNGAGKTTLLRAIMNACDVYAGSVTLDGADLRTQREHDRVRLGIGYVPDGRHVWPSLTVQENLLVGTWSVTRKHADRDARVEQALTIFPALRARFKTRAGMLSGGEQQMLAIGRALMGKPRLLLVDEPSTGLAPIAITAVVEALRELHNATRMAVLLVEQRADVAMQLCTRGYILSRGSVVREDAISSLAQSLASGYFGSPDAH
jgi:branched-chain amino acid transport system ATP-binding protein